ncbi:MAG: TSUP family transporter, partial [SAR324 cluster bacterium]|nr:TSUP family transporter [SAR324 cluster bacterium]
VLGFVSGTVGIGGGIYLVPLIILFSLGTEQEAAASGAAFILLNSVAGLVARFQRGAVSLELMLPLLLAVLAGGFLGSRLGAMRFNPLTIQKILGLVVILALLLLSRNIWFS